MYKKCDANCDATHQNLWLRGNMFYYRVELPRENASVAMQDAGIIPTYINDIIGWEGKNTMEQSYSNHTLAQIKKEMSKFNYDFLQPHFDKWKEIMKNAK